MRNKLILFFLSFIVCLCVLNGCNRTNQTDYKTLSIEKDLMTSVFGNFDSELTLSIIDSTNYSDGAKHSLSIPGAIHYSTHFVSADSTECILITVSPSYLSIREYKKEYGNEKGMWLDSYQKLVREKYGLVCSTCHACGVAMGFYVFHKVFGKWELIKSYPKFDRMGAYGRFLGDIKLLKIDKMQKGLFVEIQDGSQGETIKQLRVYCIFGKDLKKVFNERMYYCNEGAVGKPEKLFSQEELEELSEDDCMEYIWSCNFIEVESKYKLIDRGNQFYDISLETRSQDYTGEILVDTSHYEFSRGEYVKSVLFSD